MRIAYKIREKVTEKNDWIIAVIYDYDNWPGRSLSHKGLNDPNLIREATNVEINDFKQSRTTRCFFVSYNNLDGFLADENSCNVDPEIINKIINLYNIKAHSLNV